MGGERECFTDYSVSAWEYTELRGRQITGAGLMVTPVSLLPSIDL